MNQWPEHEHCRGAGWTQSGESYVCWECGAPMSAQLLAHVDQVHAMLRDYIENYEPPPNKEEGYRCW